MQMNKNKWRGTAPACLAGARPPPRAHPKQQQQTTLRKLRANAPTGTGLDRDPATDATPRSSIESAVPLTAPQKMHLGHPKQKPNTAAHRIPPVRFVGSLVP